ncbi:DUF2975 domain-containing protein [Brachybacterium paraconglomeratum]|uniref:DUF2975 domain-containing protein n=1 Tax=Micrococcales TaxID=85006 RepID=UPI003F9AA380
MNVELPRPSLGLAVATEVLVAILFVVGFAAAALLPAFSAAVAEDFPEYAALRGPLLATGIAFIVLGLIALGSIALLVHRVYRGAMLVRSSLVCVDLLVGALAGAAVVVIAASVVISRGQAGSPFLVIVEVMAFLGLVAVAGVALVLRSLLRSSIDMHDELEEVV